MRQATKAMLAVGALTAVLLPGPAAGAQTQYFCFPGEGCVVNTPQRHAACFSLAMQRGLNVSRGDTYNLNRFLFQCLSGRIPR